VTATWEGPYYWDDPSTPATSPYTRIDNTAAGYVAVTLAHLHTGKILVWNYGSQMEGHTTPEARVWNLTTRNWDTFATNGSVPFYGSNLFCTGIAQLHDGKILACGGHMHNDFGLDDTTVFDPAPATPTWIRKNVSYIGRWYPTVLQVPNDGAESTYKYFMHQGNAMPGVVVKKPQIYDEADFYKWTFPENSTMGIDNDAEHYYPHLFVMPDGRVFKAGAEKKTKYFNMSTWAWSSVIEGGEAMADYSSSAMFEPGKILKVGGGGNPNDSGRAYATSFTFDHGTGAWTQRGSLTYKRRLHNLVILPDGKVLAIGGNKRDLYEDPVFEPEIFDPATGQWSVATNVDNPNIPRWYHSVATLMPDGKVLVAGGDIQPPPYPTEKRPKLYQLFKPRYLNVTSLRPVIQVAPTSISLGSGDPTFTLTVALNPTGYPLVSKVALIRLGATTHGFDSGQRYVSLQFLQGIDGNGNPNNTLAVTEPSSVYNCPPGYYMLFVMMDSNGEKVPSVAKYIQVTK